MAYRKFGMASLLSARLVRVEMCQESTKTMNATLLPPPATEVSEAMKPEWLRLPAPGERCRFTGLSRSTLNELTIAGPANGGVAPVKSVVLRKRGALRGIRLISYHSLMGYLATLG
jgi:hypothetical protein